MPTSKYLRESEVEPPSENGNQNFYENPVFCTGVEHTVEILSTRLGSPDWHSADGSEDFDTDLGDTLMNGLAAKGLLDKETGEFASTAREAALREALEKTWELVKESAFATDDESFLRQIKTSGAPTQERDYEVAQIVISALKSPAA